MRKLITISSILLFISASSDLVSQDFIKMIKESNYTELKANSNPSIKLELERKKSNKKAETALALLKEKLVSFNPVRWESMHDGSSESKDSKYQITKIYNAEGEGLRLFIAIDSENNSKKLSSIRLRKLL